MLLIGQTILTKKRYGGMLAWRTKREQSVLSFGFSR